MFDYKHSQSRALLDNILFPPQLDDLEQELEEARELANIRLQELDKLHERHREALKDVEKLKIDVSNEYVSPRIFGINLTSKTISLALTS